MALPIILGVAAGVAAAGGVGAGIHGGIKMKDAKGTIASAKDRNESNIARFEQCNNTTTKTMDDLGTTEMRVLSSFSEFSELWAKIHNKPDFKSLSVGNTDITAYTPEEIQKASVGATLLLGGLGGAAVGTAAGFASAGATTAAVMALGTASTGTAIASLSGVAATNATLAALGGGALAAGGGGVALGTTILGASTLGVGLLIGGVIFAIAGSNVSNKADKAMEQTVENEIIIDEICEYLNNLDAVASKYHASLNKVYSEYLSRFNNLERTVSRTTNWNNFSREERLNAENTTLLVGLLYEMCKVKLVKQSEDNEVNVINNKDIDAINNKTVSVLKSFL